MPGIELHPAFAAELRRMRAKLDTISGPGVVHSRDRVYVGGRPAQADRPAPQRETTVLVGIDAALTPGGLYSGTIVTYGLAEGVTALNPNSAATDLTTLLTAAGEVDCYFINNPEFGLLTHDATDLDNEASLVGIGVYTGIPTTDGKPVIAGVIIAYKTCT